MPVDLSGAISADYKKKKRQAERFLRAGATEQAATAYLQCAELMERYAGATRDPKVRAQRLGRAKELLALAERASQARAPMPPTAEAVGSDSAASFREAAQELITRSAVAWDDIGGLEDTIREIKMAYGLTMARKPEDVEVRGWRNILFYGPPGTGKTLLAAATSNSLDATFFSVKVGNVLSKYFGESSKLITALYEEGRDCAPAVIFLDEFESLSPQRGGDESGAERRVVSTLLTELDGLPSKGDDRYVLTIAATNTPWLIDKAMLSRFEKKICVPLPDAAARRTILDIQTARRGHRLALPLEGLVERTEGYSGREMERLCREAINHMVAKTNPDLVKTVDQGQEAMRKYQLKVKPLGQADFEYAFERVQPETGADDLAEFDDWRRDAE